MLRLQGRILALSCLLAPFLGQFQTARAGAVSDGLQPPEICDQRKDLSSDLEFGSWCTLQMQETIGKTCFVVIDQIRRDGAECGWQGCRYLSLVGKAPTTTSSGFLEYGIESPRNGATFRPYGNVVLPNHPYRRVYMTAAEARATRDGCIGTKANPAGLPSEQYKKICEIDREIVEFLDINPYWRCLMKKF